MKFKVSRFLCGVVVFCLGALLVPTHAVAVPRIEHAPVTVAVRGQSVLFRVHAVSDSQPIKSATLFYAVSRDAAPYKLAMYNSGSGWFTGSIPADLISGLNQVLYYIEVRDAADATEETPWHTIAIRNPGATGSTANATAVATAGRPQPTPEAPEYSWTKPALIAGGVLLAGGAAVAIANSGGGGGGSGSSGGTSSNSVGLFSGTVTICFQPPNEASSCSSHAMNLFIDQNGAISSDTLYPNKHLEGTLAGANFLLVTSVSDTNRTGEIQFLGTVINNRIAGSVQGSATTSAGIGTYSGNFSASK